MPEKDILANESKTNDAAVITRKATCLFAVIKTLSHIVIFSRHCVRTTTFSDVENLPIWISFHIHVDIIICYLLFCRLIFEHELRFSNDIDDCFK